LKRWAKTAAVPLAMLSACDVRVPQSTLDALDQTGVDSTIFKSGTVTAQPGAQLDLVNDTMEAIEVVYP